MPLRADLLNPIPGDSPSGADIRYDRKLSIYDQIKEARREDDNLAQGDWQHERKVADFPKIVKFAQEVLATRSKDLQVAVWLTEALVRTEGFAGLQQGLIVCRDLIANFWDTLYPPIEDGDEEARSGPLDALGSTLVDIGLRSRPLVKSGYDFLKYKESRMVGYLEKAQTEREKEVRAERIAEGKLEPEEFDKAFADTPKAFYVQTEKDLDACLVVLDSLAEVCDARFKQAPPSFGKLKITLEEIRHTVHSLLEKKRETEPDEVVQAAEAEVQPQARAMAAAAGAGASASFTISVLSSSERPERREWVASIAKAAAALRAIEPTNPAPYLMMRGLRWGELRAAARLSDATLLEAPPLELRQQVKRLSLAQKWNDLLETAENAMSLPCSRAWLDLQRSVVMACTGLGGDYAAVGTAICSELKTLLQDVPELLNATLLDDTPAANTETRAWLEGLLQPAQPTVAAETAAEETSAEAPSAVADATAPSWPAKPIDSYAIAQEYLQRGQPAKAVEVMRNEIDRQRSGRGRFERTLQLARLLVSAGQSEVAQPLLEDVAAAIENHKLDSWEDKDLIASALQTLMTASQRIQDDSTERQKIFERICRLDPVRALKVE